MKKPSWQQTLGSFQIHTKTGKEAFLNEVARAWEVLYPNKADWLKRNLRRLREVTTNDGSYKNAGGGDYYVSLRIPTELWFYLRRWIPNFGDDSEDVELLKKVFCDLVRPARDHRRHTRLFVTEAAANVQKSRPKNVAPYQE